MLQLQTLRCNNLMVKLRFIGEGEIAHAKGASAKDEGDGPKIKRIGNEG